MEDFFVGLGWILTVGAMVFGIKTLMRLCLCFILF